MSPFGLVVGFFPPRLFLHDTMAKDKKSFLLYTDLIHTLEKMPNEKAGELFKHILMYVNDMNPETEDLIVQLTFEPIKQQLKRDLQRYESTCEKNKVNGAKGGRPKNPTEPKKSDGLFEEPKKPDNDTDNDNDNGNDKKEEPPKGVAHKIFVPDFETYPITYRQGLKTWWDYKVEKKQKYKPTGWETFVKSAMEDFPTAVKFNEALKHSISNNYSGLYSKGSKAEVTPPNMAKMDKDPRFL